MTTTVGRNNGKSAVASKPVSSDAASLGMSRLVVRVMGTTPLLMRNPRLADPLDPMTRRIKEITGKTRKTIADHEALARLEWEGSLYIDEPHGPYVPAEWIWRSLTEGGRTVRLGKSIERGLLIDHRDRLVPVVYEGPRDIAGLWADPGFRLTRSVNANPSSSKVSRTPRCRPMFQVWSLEVGFLFNVSQADEDKVQHAAELAGQMIGMGDGRSIGYGRFVANVEVIA